MYTWDITAKESDMNTITTSIKQTAKKAKIVAEAIRLAGDLTEAYGMDALKFDVPRDPAIGALLDADQWMAYGEKVEDCVEDLLDVDYRRITKKDWTAACEAIVRAAARRAEKATDERTPEEVAEDRCGWHLDSPEEPRCPETARGSVNSSHDAAPIRSCPRHLEVAGIVGFATVTPDRPEPGDRVATKGVDPRSRVEGVVDYVVDPENPQPGVPRVEEFTVVITVDKVFIDDEEVVGCPGFTHSAVADQVTILRRKPKGLSEERIAYQDRMHAKDRTRLGLSPR